MSGWLLGEMVATAIGIALPLYCFFLYPVMLWVLRRRSRRIFKPSDIREWPEVTVVIPVHNGKDTVADKLDQVLQLDYPTDRLHVLVVSDASDDGTDDIVRGFEGRGVRLVTLKERGGKTAAENAAREHLVGDVVLSTDVAVALERTALKRLVAPFADPTVGVTTGRIQSIRGHGDDGVEAESWYNSYDMWLRRLETNVYGVVGAAGAMFASRRVLHEEIVPLALSRDFAAPLIARERGLRSLFIPEAKCFVARSSTLRREYTRKVRTMTRGIETFLHKRHVANPLRYGRFAWMLLSHKLARWLIPVGFAVAVAALALLSPVSRSAAIAFAVVAAWGVAALVAIRWRNKAPPRPLSLAAFVMVGLIAGLQAWVAVLRGELNPVWEPTNRGQLANRLKTSAGTPEAGS